MIQATINGKKQLQFSTNNSGTLLFEDKEFDLDSINLQGNLFHIVHDGINYTAEVKSMDRELKIASIVINGYLYDVELKDKFDLLLEKLGMSHASAKKVNDVKAPMPGAILKIMAKEGQTIKKDESLLILEAMKMENVIKSPTDGVVKQITVKEGQNVEKNHILIEFVTE